MPLLQHSLPWTPVVRNVKNRRVKITVENGTYVECAMFSYFLGQKHSQMCKISPITLFLNKESTVSPFANFQKEKRSFVMEEYHAEILASLTQVICNVSELNFYCYIPIYFISSFIVPLC